MANRDSNVKNDLKDNILVDFFLTVGLPSKFVVTALQHIEENYGGDVNSVQTFNYLSNEIQLNMQSFYQSKDMIINLYPDCEKTKNDDPRFKYLDESQIT